VEFATTTMQYPPLEVLVSNPTPPGETSFLGNASINPFKIGVEGLGEWWFALKLIRTLSGHSFILGLILFILVQTGAKAIPLGRGYVTLNSAARSYQNGNAVLKKQILVIASKNGFGQAVGSIYGLDLGDLLLNSSVEHLSGYPSPLQPEGQQPKHVSDNCTEDNCGGRFYELTHRN
jgi:hypothetical protein